MSQYARLGIEIHEAGSPAWEGCPRWAVNNDGELTSCLVQTSAITFYSMPLSSIEINDVVPDICYYAECGGYPLSEDEESSLRIYLEDQDDSRIYKKFGE